MKDIVIIGAGGFGKEVAWLIEQINKKTPTWKLVGFVDDYIEVGTMINGTKVLGPVEYLKNLSIYAVCSISDPNTRQKVIESIKETSVRFPTLVHPLVELSDSVEIGEGTIICEGARFTVNIQIGRHVIIYHNDVICHDVIVSDYVSIMPSVNLSGNVKVGERSFIGVGSKIIQNIKIGSSSIIGSGTVIIRDVPANKTVVGVPGKILNQ